MKILIYNKFYSSDLEPKDSTKNIETFNVGSSKKLKEALYSVFKSMDNEGYFDDIGQNIKSFCNVCSGEGEISVKEKVFVCPECEGDTISPEDLQEEQKLFDIYNKCKNVDLEALKTLLLAESCVEVREI